MLGIHNVSTPIFSFYSIFFFFLVQIGQVAILEQNRGWLVRSVQCLSQLHVKINTVQLMEETAMKPAFELCLLSS